MEIYKRLRGMHDILPDEIEIWKKVENVFVEVSELFGFREIRTPLLESKYLFERSIGESSDIVMKEMYEFKDKKNREIALRPEGTASVVRAYIENQIYNKEKISRFYYYGPMFRYDRPQKGRYRQFYQFGVEIFGGKDPFFDGELVQMLDIILKKLEIGNFVFLINSIGCEKCKPEYVKEIKNNLENKKDQLCQDCKLRIEKNPLRVLDCKNPSCKEIISQIPSIFDFLCGNCKKHFSLFLKFLNISNIPYRIEPKLVRGLDYYTKVVFEVFPEKEEIAIAGGGRYDNLVKQMGGPNIPAAGFAAGIERIIPLIKNNFQKKQDAIYCIFLGEKAKKEGINLVKKMVEEKIKVETDYEERSLKNYLKIADRTGKRYCIIIGENEIEKNIIILKDMLSGVQEEINQDQIIEKIKEKLKC